MKEAKLVSILVPAHFKLYLEDCPKTTQEVDEMEKVLHASVADSLMYAIVCTHQDIAYAINLVSRFMKDPGKQHWMVVKEILRYLKGFVNTSLKYGKDSQNSGGAKGYVDAYFVGDRDKRRSLTWYAFSLFGIQ